jgi:hypothetical protein
VIAVAEQFAKGLTRKLNDSSGSSPHRRERQVFQIVKVRNGHVVRDHERRQTGNEFGCHKAVGREPSPTLQCRYPIFHKPAIDLVVGFLANVSG